MRNLRVNVYIGCVAIFVVALLATNLIVHTIKSISTQTPQAFAAETGE